MIRKQLFSEGTVELNGTVPFLFAQGNFLARL